MAEPRIVQAGLASLPDLLRGLGSQRVLLVSGEARREVERLSELLTDFELQIFAGARRHVPEETVVEAMHACDVHRADTVVTIGGGSATGLGKALRLRRAEGLRFVAIPSTYSGSELTDIHGVTSAGAKQTGRDERVRPDLVLYDLELTRSMPKALSITSLMNALAHPFGVLCNSDVVSLAPELRQRALDAIEVVYSAIEWLVQAPLSSRAREQALRGAGLAAQVLADGKLGAHHRLAHRLGARFDLDHSSLHSVLLPHSLAGARREAAQAIAEIEERLHVADLEGGLFDFLIRAGARGSLAALGVEAAAFDSWLAEPPELGRAARAVLRAAYLGRRPSRHVRHEDWGLREPLSLAGPALGAARRVVVCVHGRGSTADAVLRRAQELCANDATVALVAPQAPAGAWYGARYNQPRQQLGEALDRSLAELGRLIEMVGERARQAPVLLFGFSQGACLALDLFARHGERLSGLLALSGACIGTPSEWPNFVAPPKLSARRTAVPVLLGASQSDPWVARSDVEASAKLLADAGFAVQLELVPGASHALHARHRMLARELLLGRETRATQAGFGNFHETEALPGALPRDRNSPRRAPYGLYPEQINGTGFTVQRATNLRSWTYRIRPSAQHSELTVLPHPTFTDDFRGQAPEPNLSGFSALALPEAETDFVDGLCTIGGAGDAGLRRGFGLHVYAANRGMEERAFYNADGDFLLLPEHGRLTLLSELGVLDLAPGSLAIIPRGIRFSVLLPDGSARGYVAEIYGRHFELPERGTAGANGLSEARHFRAPSAWHEDRLAPGYRLTAKLGGKLYQAQQDYSPYDVVAWHGNYTPLCYDLSLFSPVSNSRFDHADPSIYTVLTSPLDEPGSNLLDLVVFVPRWDVSEGTFRPPFFHRNATSEFNGIIRDRLPDDSPFSVGGYFITPALAAHGVLARSAERALAANSDEPVRFSDDALWFQFETTLPLQLSSWANTAANRIRDWPNVWGAYRTHFGA